MSDDSSRKTLSRRQFMKTSLAGVASIETLMHAPRPASAGKQGDVIPQPFPTPIFRVDNVSTYDEQAGTEPYEFTESSSIAHDPNPDDPSIAPGTHYYHKGVEDILEKMAAEGYPFWKTRTTTAAPALPLQFQRTGGIDGGFGVGSGAYGGSGGIFGRNDIIIIKINGVAPAHCMVNVDILKGLIQRIVDHPDGFKGEVVVIDKFFFDSPTNAYHLQNTVSAVCNSFPDYKVSRLALKDLVYYEKGPNELKSGYVDLEKLLPGVPGFERISYPKFTTRYGTHIDLKRGWWNGMRYENNRVKLIGYSVLKTQRWTAVTSCLKNFLGVTNIGTVQFGGSDGDPDNGWHRTHEAIYRNGLFGRILRHVRYPDFFLVDATRILAQQPFGPGGFHHPPVLPGTLLAGFEPCNLDYYGGKEILLPQPVIAPCVNLQAPSFPALCPYDPAIPGYPCSESGLCVRHDPDFVSDQHINPVHLGVPGFAMRETPPLDAFRQYLAQCSEQLYGDVVIGPDFFRVF